MSIIRDRNGRVVVSSERITPMTEVQRQMEAERKFKELQRQRALHASAATQRDPLLRERFQRKMQQAQAAPAYGQEYGDDARAAADFTGKQLYGPTWNQPQSMPTMQDIVDGKMAREREDYTSGQYQKRMEAESDLADEVGGPGGGLDFLDAPTPMAAAGQPDIAQEQPGPQVDPMRPGRNIGPLTDFENEVGPERPRGMANIPNKRMMDEAKQLRDWRQQEFQRKRESLDQARQFKLARQIAARNQQAAEAQQRPDPVDQQRFGYAQWLMSQRDPKAHALAERVLGQIQGRAGGGAWSPEAIAARQRLQETKDTNAAGRIAQGGDERRKTAGVVGEEQRKTNETNDKLIVARQTKAQEAYDRREKFRAEVESGGRGLDMIAKELAAEEKHLAELQEEKRKNPNGTWFYGKDEKTVSIDKEIADTIARRNGLRNARAAAMKKQGERAGKGPK